MATVDLPLPDTPQKRNPPAGEATAQTLADLFKDYLRDTRADPYAISTLPPGRFRGPRRQDEVAGPERAVMPVAVRGVESRAVVCRDAAAFQQPVGGFAQPG